MTGGGANRIEMQRLDTLAEPELARLFGGTTPAGRDDLAVVAELFGAVRTDLAVLPDESTTTAHLTAMFEEAARPRSAKRATAIAVPLAERHRMRVAIAAVVAATAFAGTAYAGALPRPLQDAVSKVASAIGVSVPAAGRDTNDAPVAPVDSAPPVSATDNPSDPGDETGPPLVTSAGDAPTQPPHADGPATVGVPMPTVDRGTSGESNENDSQGAAGEDDQGTDDNGDGSTDTTEDGDQGDQTDENQDGDQGDHGDGDQGTENEGDQGDLEGGAHNRATDDQQGDDGNDSSQQLKEDGDQQ